MKNKALEAVLGDGFAFMKRRPGDRTLPYQHWGCECGDGWFELINSLCGELESAYKQRSLTPDIRVLQVKQKFGRLRFYYTFEGEKDGLVIDFLGSGTLRIGSADDGISEDIKNLRSEIKSIVSKYEEKSATVCELCGEDGSLCRLPKKYYKTLCERCCNELAKKP